MGRRCWAALLVFAVATECLEAGEKQIAVASRTVAYNGKSFRLPCPEKNIVSVLGPPDRVEKLANDILVWDELGVFAYKRPGMDEVFGFNVTFNDMRKYLKFAPRKGFQGVVLADGARISPKVTVEEVNRNKKGVPFRSDFVRYSWSAPSDGFTYFINQGTIDRWTEMGPIVEFSVEFVRPKS